MQWLLYNVQNHNYDENNNVHDSTPVENLVHV